MCLQTFSRAKNTLKNESPQLLKTEHNKPISFDIFMTKITGGSYGSMQKQHFMLAANKSNCGYIVINCMELVECAFIFKEDFNNCLDGLTNSTPPPSPNRYLSPHGNCRFSEGVERQETFKNQRVKLFLP